MKLRLAHHPKQGVATLEIPYQDLQPGMATVRKVRDPRKAGAWWWEPDLYVIDVVHLGQGYVRMETIPPYPGEQQAGSHPIRVTW